MAEAAKRVSTKTELLLPGGVKIPIGLFSTNAKAAGVPKFETAGPNGGRLRYEDAAIATPENEAEAEEVGVSDPLALDPGPEETPEPSDLSAALAGAVGSKLIAEEAAASAPGEFRQQLVEAGTDVIVTPEMIRRGVWLGEGEDARFIDLTEQVDAIEARTKLDQMEVVAFIDSASVPRARVTDSYYVAPYEGGGRALGLMWHAMRASRRAAVVKWTKTTRQAQGIVIASFDPEQRRVLVVLQLVWAEDFRDAPLRADLSAVEPKPEELAAAVELIEAMHDVPKVLSTLRDDALALRQELIERALAGEMEPAVVEPLPEAPEEAGLEDALTASLAAVRGSAE